MTHSDGVANYFPVMILSWVTSLPLYKLLCSFQAVEILKTAREISMRVRFFPYSKCHSLFNLPGRALGRNSVSTAYLRLHKLDMGNWEIRTENNRLFSPLCSFPQIIIAKKRGLCTRKLQPTTWRRFST